jgi:hypothetical protein
MLKGFHSFCGKSAMAAILMCASLGPLLGQSRNSCPDWPPVFNQIQGSAMRQELQSERAAGWPQLNASLSNPGQAFAQGNQIIAMAQSRIQSDRQGIQQIAVGNPGPVNDAICTSGRGSALTALQCDIFYSQDLILATQGTLQLLQCRSGFAGSIGGGAAGGGLGSGGSTANMSDLLHSLFGANPPTPLASQSNFQDFENNRANSPVVGDAAGAELADANSNASQLAANDKATDPLTAETDAFLSTNNAPNSTQTTSPLTDANTQPASDSDWKDPLGAVSQDSEQLQANPPDLNVPSDSGTAPKQSQENQIDGTLGTTDTSQSSSGSNLGSENQELAVALLKDGIASSGEVGETAVQAFDNSEGWLKLQSSDPNDQVDGITQIMNGANKASNGNEASAIVTEQGTGVIGSTAKQEFNLLGTMNSALNGDVSPSELDQQTVALPQDFAKQIIPGYKASETIQQDLQNAQTNITSRVKSGIQSIQNFFTAQPPCVFCP